MKRVEPDQLQVGSGKKTSLDRARVDDWTKWRTRLLNRIRVRQINSGVRCPNYVGGYEPGHGQGLVRPEARHA